MRLGDRTILRTYRALKTSTQHRQRCVWVTELFGVRYLSRTKNQHSTQTKMRLGDRTILRTDRALKTRTQRRQRCVWVTELFRVRYLPRTKN
ncbi:hypothetical protein RRG08_050101 [Elysia crispata]|uniref:Uncharacterized protein n=1 Tax=Elysia crispata TaxID=231223 RepID=A0AAE0Z5S8_9GAST|nr:hypothetical protein RRG08_050101 [Elysia crispata]